jgi:hypothetical protein
MVERTQLVAEVLAMAFLMARCFTRIQYKVRLGAMNKRRTAMEAAEGMSW